MEKSLWKFWKRFKKEPRFWFLGLGLILVTGGLIFSFWSQTHQREEIIFETLEKGGLASPTGGRETVIKADIAGAVLKPGLYELKGDPRVQDLLLAAGGLSAAADRAWVEKNLNLAQKLNDGAKIYIPPSSSLLGSPSQISQISPSSPTSPVVSINSATAAELDALPVFGFGPATAQKIVDNRPYQSIEDLLTKKVVSKSLFEKLKPFVSVY